MANKTTDKKTGIVHVDSTGLLACESCWTHSIPLEDMEGVDELECPACGCFILIVGMFDGMDLTRWGGGSNTCWKQANDKPNPRG